MALLRAHQHQLPPPPCPTTAGPCQLTKVRRMACATCQKDLTTEYVVAESRPVEISSNRMAEAGPHRISPVVTRLRWPLWRRCRAGWGAVSEQHRMGPVLIKMAASARLVCYCPTLPPFPIHSGGPAASPADAALHGIAHLQATMEPQCCAA